MFFFLNRYAPVASGLASTFGKYAKDVSKGAAAKSVASDSEEEISKLECIPPHSREQAVTSMIKTYLDKYNDPVQALDIVLQALDTIPFEVKARMRLTSLALECFEKARPVLLRDGKLAMLDSFMNRLGMERGEAIESLQTPNRLIRHQPL